MREFGRLNHDDVRKDLHGDSMKRNTAARPIT